MFPLRLFSGFMTLALCASRQYVFVNENKTWTEAQSYCREKYTDLATLENEQETIQLLNMMDDHNDLAWIGLYDDINSWKWTLEDTDFFKETDKQFRNWHNPGPGNYGGQNLCVYIDNGIWIEIRCSLQLPFICYDGGVNASSSYVSVYQYKNWTEAQSYCREHHTDLVSIRNETENQKIQILWQNIGPAWIGLYRSRSWSDQSNSSFSNWMPGQPDNAVGSEYCTVVSLGDSGKWTDENCLHRFPFLCYSVSSLASSRQYHFISVNNSWYQAQTYCREKYTDLATIDNMDEMNSLMNTVNGSYNGSAWIGLYDDLNSWRWSLENNDFYQEGEKNFRNWYHEPDNNGGNELCVYMKTDDGTWFDSICDIMLSFICYDGRENATQRYITITEKKTWTEARRYCKEHHTDLVGIRNRTENRRLLQGADAMIWIGLYRNRIWSDRRISNYQNWRPGSHRREISRALGPKSGFQTCTAVSLGQLGKWTYESCVSIKPFFCYSKGTVSPHQYHFISESKSWFEAQRYCRENYIDLATIENKAEMNKLLKTVRGIYSGSAWIGLYDDMNSWRWSLGNTELGGGFKSWNVRQPQNWYGQSLCVLMSYQAIWYETICSNEAPFICYDARQNAGASYVYVYDAKNWTEAQSYCREHHTDLVSIRNETENQKILTFFESYQMVWIGLYRRRSWSDQSNSTFSNWIEGEPNNVENSEGCTVVSFSDSGKWADENCYHRLPFLCYNVASSFQYHFISVNKTWTEAQRYCRENYIDLATIENMDEMNNLINTVNGSYNGSAWIGLYDDVNSWRWSLENNDFYQEGEREFRNWYHQPDNYLGNELCVYMDANDGTWFDVSCDSFFTFLCYNDRENASQKYVLVYQEKTWSEARRYCREFYTDLASVRNETEHKEILSIKLFLEITEGRNDNNLWIGLHRKKLWSDQSNSSFTYSMLWTTNLAPEPDNGLSVGLAGIQHCTAVSLEYFGYWTDERCSDRLPFFCYNGEKCIDNMKVYIM
nr:macrophage mannose receptor 1-like isoform X1 [Misgurnus anguillicaudatus]XP_055035773.1 macrophage mannose receptor 1-like isoform X1 [Misgurnus anguillicaudatus]XP_055035774.1 macrophage mannose receptor 1-like isoform X1 [Misgurnus anguillicaudatus]